MSFLYGVKNKYIVWKLPAKFNNNAVISPPIIEFFKFILDNKRNIFAPIENASVKPEAAIVESIRLNVMLDGKKEIFVNTAVARWPK